jgi:transposase-like protein
MKKYGEQHWKPLLLEWSESGANVGSFCKEKGISSSSFKYWRNKFPNLLPDKTSLKIKERFVEVQQNSEIFEDRLKPINSISKYLIIKTSYGCTIEVPL